MVVAKATSAGIAARRGARVWGGGADVVARRQQRLLRSIAGLVGHGCDLLTIAQYLRPTPMHLPVIEYVHSDKFRWWGEQAQSLGFESVASGPLVRSSFHADELAGTVRAGEASKAG